jgi:hypothetical protein
MRLIPALVACLALAACTSTPADDPEAVAPSNTITRYPSTAPPRPAEEVSRDNRASAAAAVPTDAEVPGLAPARPKQAVLTLCPTLTFAVPASVTHAYGVWRGGGRSLAVTAVLDPANAPADRLLATLFPPDCPSDVDGVTYVYDRQPIERSDGWTGALNTILATDTRTGKHSYQAAYLLSKGDALVNVIAGRDGRQRFDPSVDESAADHLELALARFAV